MAQRSPIPLQCPACGAGMIAGSTSYSFDTFVIGWSDGRGCQIPRSRKHSVLWTCPARGCGRISREDEMARADDAENYAVEPRFEDYVVYGDKRCHEGDLHAAFSAYLLAFWRMNDPMRIISSSDYFRTSHITFKINQKGLALVGKLRSLLQMSDSSDRLLAAELARQQSQFSLATELADIAEENKNLIRLRDTILRCSDMQLPIVTQIPWG